MPSIEGDIILSYFDDEDLIEALEDRGYIVRKSSFNGLITEAVAKRMRRDHTSREPLTDKIAWDLWVTAQGVAS